MWRFQALQASNWELMGKTQLEFPYDMIFLVDLGMIIHTQIDIVIYVYIYTYVYIYIYMVVSVNEDAPEIILIFMGFS